MKIRKRMGRKGIKVLIAFSIIACVSSVSTVFGASQGKLTVYVVNYPLMYFAERIGGDRVAVAFPASGEGDPAYWTPDAKTIGAYQQADLILLNGANYAKWVRKVSLPRSKMVDTSAKFKDRYITADEIVTHSHGSEGAHAHESLAFTTWIDFDLASKQAKAVANALSRKRPDQREMFEKNYSALEKELMDIDTEIKKSVSKGPAIPLIASHPVYDYFARRYGLNMKSVHWEPDEVPNGEQWISLQQMRKSHPARWMVWEGEPMKESVERLKGIGVDSLIFNPCGNTPEKGDFLSVMQQNVNNLQKAFK